jgi:hypothetical protein
MFVGRRDSLLAVLIGCAGILALGSLRLDAQEPSGAKAEVAKKVYDASRRVPVFFAQIGLSKEQKEEIYKIRSKYLDKIAALEKQIDEVKAEEMRECESKLSASQKQLLDARRRASAELKKARAAAKSEPAPPAAKSDSPPKTEK